MRVHAKLANLCAFYDQGLQKMQTEFQYVYGIWKRTFSRAGKDIVALVKLFLT